MNRSLIIFLFISIFAVNLAGIFLIDVMDIDASTYASMGYEMLNTGNFLQVKERYEDHLDKPPFLFWISALFYYLFGFSHIVYRIPPLLFTLLGLYATFRLGTHLYNRKTGILAALILFSCQGWFMMAHDVRTDTILVNTIIFASWQIYRFLETGRMANLVGASAGVGIAMLTKGPIGLMVPLLAYIPELIYRKRIRDFLTWKLIIAVAIIAVMLLPMLIGLYQQYGWKGIRFYFWTKSFGRITGENMMKDPLNDYFFFVHTFLWTFAPWALLAIFGLISKIRGLIRERFDVKANNEVFVAGGALLPIIALSFAQYKLPHYIFVTFPFFAILTARYVVILFKEDIPGRSFRYLFPLQVTMNLVILILMVFLIVFVFPPELKLYWILPATLIILCFFSLFIPRNKETRIIAGSVLAIISLNLILNTWFYPHLMHYQAGSKAARYVNEHHLNKKNIYLSRIDAHSFDIYAGTVVPFLDIQAIPAILKEKPTILIFGDQEWMEEIRRSGLHIIQ